MSNNEFEELMEFIDSLNYRCDVLKKEFINLRNGEGHQTLLPATKPHNLLRLH